MHGARALALASRYHCDGSLWTPLQSASKWLGCDQVWFCAHVTTYTYKTPAAYLATQYTVR